MKTLNFVSLLVICSVFCGFAGCGGKEKPAGLPELYPAMLTITQAGKPLADAAVTLQPIGDTVCTWTIGARTDNAGKATLMTHGDFLGAPAGKFAVVVVKTEMSLKEGAADEEGNPIQADSQEKLASLDGRFLDKFNVVASEYGTVDTTPLEAEITAGKNNITLDVGEAVREPL